MAGRFYGWIDDQGELRETGYGGHQTYLNRNGYIVTEVETKWVHVSDYATLWQGKINDAQLKALELLIDAGRLDYRHCMGLPLYSSGRAV